MLRLAKKGFLHNNFQVVDEDSRHTFGLLRGTDPWTGASIEIDGTRVQYDGSLSRDRFEVSREGVVLGRAEAVHDAMKWKAWTVEHGAGTLSLEQRTTRVYDVAVDGIEGGATVEVVGFSGRRITTDLAGAVPVEIRLLACVIPLTFWTGTPNLG